jgi:hypothetical protein
LNLGYHAEALALYDGALGGTTLPARRAKLHEHMTEACVGMGDPERACASAHAALDEADTHGLGIISGKIRMIRRAFPARWSLLTPVSELDERLHAVA